MKNKTTVERKSERELVMSRTFNGPARIVFEAWTKPELLHKWWAPKSMGITLLSCKADVRPGGSYRFELGKDPSKSMVFFGKYLEVVPPSRLVWTNEESPDGAVTTLTLDEKDGKTRLTLHEVYPSKEALDQVMAGMGGGMNETFDQLDELLAGIATVTKRTAMERKSDRELVLTRRFNASAQLLFDAWTKPELLKKWWAPKSMGVTLFSCEVDLRVGGHYRFGFGRDPNQQMVFSGIYTEINAPNRLVHTQLFEQMPGDGEAVITATFTEHGPITEFILHQLFPSKKALDSALASGMDKGMFITFDQLDELVTTT